MPASRAKIKRQSKPRTPGAGKVSGGHCQHTGLVRYDSLSAARKVAGPDQEAVSCAYCRGAHIKAAKRRKQSQRNNNR
jgi:hypothetical protein